MINAEKLYNKSQNVDQKKYQIFLQVAEAVDARDEDRAINLLSSFKKTEDAKILDLPVPKKNGYGLLHLAAINHLDKIITSLYDLGANPNCTDDNQNMPLHCLLRSQRFTTGTMKGGRTYSFNKKKPLTSEEIDQRTKTLEELLKHPKIEVNKITSDAGSPLKLAKTNCSAVEVNMLIQKGAKLTDAEEIYEKKKEESNKAANAVIQKKSGIPANGGTYLTVQKQIKSNFGSQVTQKTPAISSKTVSSDQVANLVTQFSKASTKDNGSEFSQHPRATPFKQAINNSISPSVPVTRDRAKSTTEVWTKAIVTPIVATISEQGSLEGQKPAKFQPK